MPKSRASDIGTKRNANAIVKLARVDDDAHRHVVRRARDLVYLEGYGVKSAAVDRLLGSRSLVPAKVFLFFFFVLEDIANFMSRMHSLRGILFRSNLPQLFSDFPD